MNPLNVNMNSPEKLEVPARETSRSEQRAYHELPSLRHETRDVLKQLEGNILLLEDLGGRLSFVLSEVRSLIRR